MRFLVTGLSANLTLARCHRSGFSLLHPHDNWCGQWWHKLNTKVDFFSFFTINNSHWEYFFLGGSKSILKPRCRFISARYSNSCTLWSMKYSRFWVLFWVWNLAHKIQHKLALWCVFRSRKKMCHLRGWFWINLVHLIFSDSDFCLILTVSRNHVWDTGHCLLTSFGIVHSESGEIWRG